MVLVYCEPCDFLSSFNYVSTVQPIGRDWEEGIVGLGVQRLEVMRDDDWRMDGAPDDDLRIDLDMKKASDGVSSPGSKVCTCN